MTYKKKKKRFNKGQKVGKWILESFLGGGGNGEVWKCVDDKSNVGAIKLLKSLNPKSYARFLDETTVIEKNKDVVGIMPMIDKYLPADPNRTIPFFVMPVAESAEKKLRGKNIEDKIDAILQVCESLKELHDRGISHRDLKPANLLFFNSRFSIADFGLVDYPNKQDVSLKNEEIGAKWTLPPEMRRESSKANGLKADIYSLAKTLWIILTEKTKGFDGQYSSQSVLGLRNYFHATFTTPLDSLLTSCTDNDPNQRPNIEEFISKLQGWKVLNEDFHSRNLEQWFEIQKKLFPTAFPKRVIWEDINDIINVLKIICSYDNLNHMFYPNSGGLDLEDARLSHEEGCIELDFGLIDIVKPKRLIFESFGYDPEWNYFRLELDELEPAKLKGQEEEEEEFDSEEFEEFEDDDFVNDRNHETVSELYPKVYDRYELVEYRSD